MIQNLAEKTGHDLAWWVRTARGAGLAKHGEIVRHLKSEHGLTHGYANLVAHKALEPDGGAPAGDALIDAQYAGAKAGLRPTLDALLAAVRAFGDDVEIAPKKTSVSLRRSKQFAVVTPATKTRVDVGIQLKGDPAGARLEESGNAMTSHRVRLEGVEAVDAELLDWLREAYDRA